MNLTIATIKITRTLTSEDDVIYVTSEDESGETLALVDALGMLRFAEDTLIRDAMDETPNDNEELP